MMDKNGHLVDAVWWQQRSALLRDYVEAVRPAVLVVEGFPFARRRFRQEILELIEYVKLLCPDALIVSSIRDILQPRSPEREEATQVWLQHFDRVLIHGDPLFMPLSASCGFTEKIAQSCFYTGWVTAQIMDAITGEAGTGEVIVSAGGGAVGEELLSLITKTRPRSRRLRHASWRVLVGNRGQTITAEPIAAEPIAAEHGVIVEPVRDDFRTLLSNCRVSVSQAGYNTVADLVTTDSHAVLVPFEGSGEQEQLMRANRMAELGRAIVVRETALTANNLATAIDLADQLPTPTPLDIDRSGASKTAALLQSWLS